MTMVFHASWTNVSTFLTVAIYAQVPIDTTILTTYYEPQLLPNQGTA